MTVKEITDMIRLGGSGGGGGTNVAVADVTYDFHLIIAFPAGTTVVPANAVAIGSYCPGQQISAAATGGHSTRIYIDSASKMTIIVDDDESIAEYFSDYNPDTASWEIPDWNQDAGPGEPSSVGIPSKLAFFF